MKKTITLLLLLFSLNNLFAQAPPGYNFYYVFDEDNDGYATFDINQYYAHIRSIASNGGTGGFDLSGYTLTLHSSNGSPITTNFYVNQIQYSEMCTLHLDYTGSGPSYLQATLDYLYGRDELTTIDPNADNDGDSVSNRLEDLNNDNSLNNDDTDNDGILNFKDSDDDGDGVLSIDEDYNRNGSPLDDDTNSNGIADYLDSSVTLSTNSFTQNREATIYPNPTKDYVTINTLNDDYVNVEVLDLSGKSLLLKNNGDKLDLSGLTAGVYFLKINWIDKSLNYKIIKQ